MQEENPTGVVIPQETVEKSDTNKRKSKKTLTQLPVYRATANLKYIVTALMMKSPKKLTKFFDQMLVTVSEAKKSIGMADISRTPQDRSWYLDCARVLIQDVSDDFTTLRRLEVPASETADGKARRFPIVSRDLDNKAKALMKSITAQLVAWRDYTNNNEGANSETDSEREK